MVTLSKFLLVINLFLACFAFANKSQIAKAVNRANSAYKQVRTGPERHRGLITAYWVNEGDTVLDLGAHVGDYSSFYGQLVGFKGIVVSYEASPPVYEFLAKRFGTSMPNIVPRNRAVSDTTNQTIMMKIYPNDIRWHSSTVEPFLWCEERMPGNTAIVEALTEKVDDFIKDHDAFSPVRFIKIDTEGHEHAVIRGARKVLLEQRPLVIFEYGFQKDSWEPNTIAQMEELGYVCYDCNTDQRVHPGYGARAIPYLLTDLLAIPIEFEEEIRAVLSSLY